MINPEAPTPGVTFYTFTPRKGRGKYGELDIRAGKPERRVTITVSPTGRVVHVWVNGRRVTP
jgi:hypothetical protein